MFRGVCYDIYYPSDAHNHVTRFAYETAEEAVEVAKKLAEEEEQTGISYWAERDGYTKHYLEDCT